MKRFTPAWLAVCLACSFSTSSLAADALATRAFQGMPADFIKGADISTLLDAEKHGATFYDQNNQRKDPIAILKENGVNYVRLRLWVDPQSASGEDYGGGNNDLATTLYKRNVVCRTNRTYYPSVVSTVYYDQRHYCHSHVY